MKKFDLSKRSLVDLQTIWESVGRDSLDAADRLLEEFYRAFEQLARMPGIGHRRQDLTAMAVRFFRLHSYLIIYKDSTPLRVVRILHGKRDVKKILQR